MEISYLYNPSDWKGDFYRFHLDAFKKEHGVIKGWLVFFGEPADFLFEYITIGGELKKKKIDCVHFRPRLKDIYSDIEDVEFSGFEIDINDLESFHEGSFSILINGIEKKVAKAYVKPPLLYVHIAKTAGTTVNKVLVDFFGSNNSIVHAESVSDWQTKVNNDELLYLSGHIPFSVFNKNKKVRSFKKAITFREPYSHLVSHLSWIRSLSLEENKKRYDFHPDYIQKLSDKLASYNFSVPDQIRDMIDGLNPLEYRLLDNTQIRYMRTNLSKVSIDENDLVDAIENLSFFDFVGTDRDIYTFFINIANFYGFNYRCEDRRENVLNNKFGLDVEGMEVRKALFPLIKYDLELYKIVNK